MRGWKVLKWGYFWIFISLPHRVLKITDFGLAKVRSAGSGTPTVIDFAEGQTEVWLAPPVGNYNLRLELVDNVDGAKRLTTPAVASVRVE